MPLQIDDRGLKIGDLVRVLPSAADCTWGRHGASAVASAGLIVDILDARPGGHAYAVCLDRLRGKSPDTLMYSATELALMLT